MTQNSVAFTNFSLWSQSRVPLRLALGDVSLATIRLPLALWTANGTESPLLDADIAELPDLLEKFPSGLFLKSYPVAQPLAAISRVKGGLCYIPHQFHRYYIDLTGSFDTYQGKFSSKSRSTIRRKLRKFAERSGGSIDWRQYRTPEELEVFHAGACKVSALTYQERLLNAGIPRNSAFRERMARLAAQDRVRGYLLYLDGKPVSYLYCPIEDNVLIYQFLGYDPAYASLSPGTVLQWCVVESLFAEGCYRAFDFTQGEGDHKRFFSTDSNLCANIVVLPSSPTNWGVVLLHCGLDRFSGQCGRMLDRFELKKRVKRLLRRQGS
ncbi:GNAT family N-acetyltransferase [Virgifigura deserti]|uniref:GNAT family N-acetyltransferase n=1 Tax=Virgifigura deserti TaxID=2268457 RepID=UPI003CCBB08D